MHFRIRGLPAEKFAPLFALSDAALAAQGAVRRIADGREPGYPCRISLTDSKPGDELILANYEHHPVASPYRMRFAIFVRKGEETFDELDTVPEQLRKRTLAVRAFDGDAMMVGFELVEGVKLESAIERQFTDPRAAYLHVHFAAPGCSRRAWSARERRRSGRGTRSVRASRSVHPRLPPPLARPRPALRQSCVIVLPHLLTIASKYRIAPMPQRNAAETPSLAARWRRLNTQ